MNDHSFLIWVPEIYLFVIFCLLETVFSEGVKQHSTHVQDMRKDMPAIICEKYNDHKNFTFFFHYMRKA